MTATGAWVRSPFGEGKSGSFAEPTSIRPCEGHLLRHSLARQMLRHGASFAEIEEVLRHRDGSRSQRRRRIQRVSSCESRTSVIENPVAGSVNFQRRVEVGSGGLRG